MRLLSLIIVVVGFFVIKGIKMEIQIKDLEKGDKVWCGGDSGFCSSDIEIVKKVKWNFDKKSGEKYKVIVLSEGRKFDSRDGWAITSPTAYYLMPTEQ